YMLQQHINNTRAPMWQMRPDNEAAKRFLHRAVDTVDQRHYPDPTVVSGQPETYLFRFTKQELKGADREYIMEVMDWPGEWFEDPEKGGADLLNYLTRCKGLLCLVDPDRGENEPFMAFLAKLLMDLQYTNNNNRIDKKIAFCLTKMDEPQHRPFLYLPNAYIRQKMGENMIQRIQMACAPGKVSYDWACSAVGFFPGKTPLRSNSGIEFDGQKMIYNIKEIKPFGLFEPLEKWLFVD
ncbi:MAG: hypothetical protein WCF84_06360, partial [Anaerolineae bacterium]